MRHAHNSSPTSIADSSHESATATKIPAEFNILPITKRRLLLKAFVGKLSSADVAFLHRLTAPQLDVLTLLPPSIATRILAYLDIRAIYRVQLVSRRWYSFVHDNVLLWQWLIEMLPTTTRAREHIDRIVRNPTLPLRNVRLRPVGSADPTDAELQSDKRLLCRAYQTAFWHDHVLARNWRHNLCRSVAFECHGTNVITCLQILNEHTVITGSDDGSMHIWHAQTGSLLGTLEGHNGGVWALKATHNLLVSGSTDRTLRVWDLTNMTHRSDLVGHTSTVRCVEIVGPWAISGSRDGTLRVWDWASGMCIHVLSGHSASVRCLAVLDDSHIVSGSYDNTCRIWDIRNGSCIHELRGHQNKIYSVVADEKLGRVYSGSLDNDIRVWDSKSGACIRVLAGHRALVGILQLREGILISGSTDGAVRAWDAATLEPQARLTNAHPSSVTSLDFNHVVVVSGSESMVRVWDRLGFAALYTLLEEVEMVWRVAVSECLAVVAYSARGTTRLSIHDFTPMHPPPK